MTGKRTNCKGVITLYLLGILLVTGLLITNLERHFHHQLLYRNIGKHRWKKLSFPSQVHEGFYCHDDQNYSYCGLSNKEIGPATLTPLTTADLLWLPDLSTFETQESSCSSNPCTLDYFEAIQEISRFDSTTRINQLAIPPSQNSHILLSLDTLSILDLKVGSPTIILSWGDLEVHSTHCNTLLVLISFQGTVMTGTMSEECTYLIKTQKAVVRGGDETEFQHFPEYPRLGHHPWWFEYH